ncbi:RpiB/LacA/LacB family sugar-phosphate isomerase [Candidatus Dependentiae bacterium]|nr:RpiB/LacA/LacB family sugar-phosphate isomerase [Candidatus Dependentiae bacterium]
MHKTLAIGADHRGYMYKEQLKKISQFGGCSVTWIDVGVQNTERADYPVPAQAAVAEIKNGNAQGALLLCGSGVGMAIAANRFPGIYAAVVWEPIVARMAKEDDNANVLSLSADYVDFKTTVQCIEEWLNATFKEGRYAFRLSLID